MGPAEGGGLFLDRDGILNELVFYPSSGEWESPRTAADLRVRGEALEVFAALSRAGWPLFLVSNQPSCAKGKTSMEDLRAVHGALMEACAAADLAFRESYYCYHHPDSIRPELRGPCPCRKPSPHFLREAAKSFGLDLARSWMVGDQDMDVLCGQNAGCRTVLVAYPPSANKRGQAKPDHSCDDVMSLLTLL